MAIRTNSILVAHFLALTGSIIRNRRLKTPHSWLNLSAILKVWVHGAGAGYKRSSNNELLDTGI